MLENVRRRLRALVKPIEHEKRRLVYSDFEDRTGAATEAIVPGIAIGTDIDAFKRKARMFLKPYENHIAVLRLKRNEPLTPTDLTELARIFLEAMKQAPARGVGREPATCAAPGPCAARGASSRAVAEA